MKAQVTEEGKNNHSSARHSSAHSMDPAVKSHALQGFHIYAALVAASCLSHLSMHLEAARFHHLEWWLAISVVAAAAFLLQKVTLGRFFLLIGLQIAHTIVFSPFNPDHWLLLFFVNSVTLMAAGSLAIKSANRHVDSEQLLHLLAPAGRTIFLICYGFAAFSKLNTHFLGTEASCARELAEFQVSVSPWLGYLAIPSLAGWITVLCECSVFLLLLAPRFRKYGIVVGMIFHTLLVISPAIAVFDFTITVFTMLFLFTPKEFIADLSQRWQKVQSIAPAVVKLFSVLRTPAVFFIAIYMISRSAMGEPMYGTARLSIAKWLINIGVAVTLIAWTFSILFSDRSKRFDYQSMLLSPRIRLQWLVVLVAIVNGLCPYLGLKTQGSFTMFSNLRTEAGHWNHLIAPQSMRIFDNFQDSNFDVVSTNDYRLQADYVELDYLVPKFEIQRVAAINPEFTVTLRNNGDEVMLKSATLVPILGTMPNWWLRKLMIFRPVTRHGEPYCGN